MTSSCICSPVSELDGAKQNHHEFSAGYGVLTPTPVPRFHLTCHTSTTALARGRISPLPLQHGEEHKSSNCRCEAHSDAIGTVGRVGVAACDGCHTLFANVAFKLVQSILQVHLCDVLKDRFRLPPC